VLPLRDLSLASSEEGHSDRKETKRWKNPSKSLRGPVFQVVTSTQRTSSLTDGLDRAKHFLEDTKGGGSEGKTKEEKRVRKRGRCRRAKKEIAAIRVISRDKHVEAGKGWIIWSLGKTRSGPRRRQGMRSKNGSSWRNNHAR